MFRQSDLEGRFVRSASCLADPIVPHLSMCAKLKRTPKPLFRSSARFVKTKIEPAKLPRPIQDDVERISRKGGAKKTTASEILSSTRVGASGVNAGTRRTIGGPEGRPHNGMNLAPLFGSDARALSRKLLRSRTRKSESDPL